MPAITICGNEGRDIQLRGEKDGFAALMDDLSYAMGHPRARATAAVQFRFDDEDEWAWFDGIIHVHDGLAYFSALGNDDAAHTVAAPVENVEDMISIAMNEQEMSL